MNTPLFVTPERQESVLFSRGAWMMGDGLLVRAADVDRIGGYEALGRDPSLRLAVVAGQVQEQAAFRAGIPPGSILRVASPEQAVEAVRSRRGGRPASTPMRGAS